jgi:protoporphyrinogen oxidase
MNPQAIIIGAGPAGLTAAYELLTRTGIKPIVLEKSAYMGGISRTVNFKGNRIDIGGHRFFSKSDRVMEWWLRLMPVEAAQSVIGSGTAAQSPRPASASDEVMLLRSRKSRIYFLRKFFEYPITLSVQTIRNLGLARTLKIGFSYLRVAVFPPKQVDNLEQFFISRFGRELYQLFFKSYTEKVWGIPCSGISAEWGAQRIKGLSITKTVLHVLKKLAAGSGDIKQKGTETSLIEQFMYPKLGPGQLWELVARQVIELGGEIIPGFNVDRVHVVDGRLQGVSGSDRQGKRRDFEGDYVFSSMPIKDLVNSLDCAVPDVVHEVSNGLVYRDFITVGLLLKKLEIRDETDPQGLVRDNWIYIQEPEVAVGRLQIFNNWSPYLVRDPDTVWIGVEYFCYEGDELWRLSDEKMAALARQELEKIGIIRQSDVLDSTVIRMPKTYPAYFGSYPRFSELRRYLDGFANLFLVGRNGMHRYNNMDHSMLAAMTAVDNILAGRSDKSNIWAVNSEEEYHEEQKAAK